MKMEGRPQEGLCSTCLVLDIYVKTYWVLTKEFEQTEVTTRCNRFISPERSILDILKGL